MKGEEGGGVGRGNLGIIGFQFEQTRGTIRTKIICFHYPFFFLLCSSVDLPCTKRKNMRKRKRKRNEK